MTAPIAVVGSERTVLEALVERLRSRSTVPDGQERPSAILWTDPESEWLPLAELLLSSLEELIVLGGYKPDSRTGPAIWIRCLVDGALSEPELPGNHVPIVYLPGIARQDLRAGESCPQDIRPIVELMYRGVLWLQPNGSDWGVATFLTSPKALGLDIARDQATTAALLRALPEVALTQVSQLSGRRLEADDFDRMLSGDVIRDLLRWMGEPKATRARLGPNGWAAFCSRCRDEIDFDPEAEADVTAGERLAAGEGAWEAVWDRFAEAPGSFRGIADLLRRSAPSGAFRFNRERWPDLNDEDEQKVRDALAEIPTLSHTEACDAASRLEEEHGPRRDWLWARMGHAPMAAVLAPLRHLADAARTAIGGTTPADVAEAYLQRGWMADASAWEAIAAAPTADEAIVGAAVRRLQIPWLEDSARAFQASLERAPLPDRGDQPLVEAAEDVCILFADGLRYDVGQRLAERLDGLGCRVNVGHRWAALPTVTATAKPAVTPVADAVAGDELGETFEAKILDSGAPANAKNLRSAMQRRGYQILGPEQADWPESQPARGWVEAGEIDELGHKLQLRLARQISEELDRLAERITGLLDAGWTGVRVVTDHGWLLLPGGLPKVDLPKHLTASRWARCAVIAGASTPDVTRASWHWNAGQSFAAAPGIACFNKSDCYAHGGISIQECLTPDLFVERGGEAPAKATITSVTWRGMRCFLEATAQGSGVKADLRLERPTGQSVVASIKPVEPDGSVSLVVTDDEYEDSPLVVVLVDDSGTVLTQRPTRIGADS